MSADMIASASAHREGADGETSNTGLHYSVNNAENRLKRHRAGSWRNCLQLRPGIEGGRNMHRFGRITAYIIAATLSTTVVATAQGQPGLTVQRLSETVYVLMGEGGNIGVSTGADGTFIIDDMYEGDGEMISAVVARLSELPISYVLNTHWHFDHAGSNDFFGHAGSIIVAHANVRKMLARGAYISVVDKKVPPAPAEALPVITFDDSLSLHLNGEEVHMLHVTPGHTDGDGIVWFRSSNVVHMGDTFLSGMYPLIDVDSGGDINGMITTADTVLSFVDDETRLIPGHGPVSGKATLKAYRDMCVTLRDRVWAMKKDGMSLEEVIAANPTADFDEDWGNGGVDWTRISLGSIYADAPTGSE
jgi:cyclase